MENLTINQGIKFLVGDGKGVIGTADPSGSQGISKTAGHTGFYIQSSVDYTLYFYDGSAWASHQSIDVSDANYAGGFAFAWEDNTAAYIKTADSSHIVYVFARNTDLKVDSTPGDATQGADSIVDGTGSLSITSINAQNYYTEALSVDNSGTVTFDRTDDNSAYQLKFEGTNITIGNNGSDTITLTGGDEFTSPLTTDGDLFIQDGSADSRLGIGSDGQYLSVSSGSPAWVDLSASPWSTYTSPDDYVEFTAGGVSIGGGNTYTAGGEPYRDGVLVVGKTNTLNKVQRGLIVGYDNQMGKNNYSSAGSMFGMSNIIYDGTANHVMGASNYAGYGNYNQAFGYQNRVYGDNNIALGRANHAGNASANVEDTVTIGFSNKAMSDKQIIIGHSVQTNSTNTTEEGIYFGLSGQHNMVIMRETGVTGKPANLTFGGFNNGTYLGTGNSGAGSGIFYLSNSQHGYTIEPTSNMPDSVGMWAKDRASGKKGMMLKSENGGMSWIGDRIGVNVTSNGTSTHSLSSTIDASLHVFGEGSTSATSSFKVENSSNSDIFTVRDDRAVIIEDGGPNYVKFTDGYMEMTSTSTSNTIGQYSNQSMYIGSAITAAGNAGSIRKSLVVGTTINVGLSSNLNESLVIGKSITLEGGDTSIVMGRNHSVKTATNSFIGGLSFTTNSTSSLLNSFIFARSASKINDATTGTILMGSSTYGFMGDNNVGIGGDFYSTDATLNKWYGLGDRLRGIESKQVLIGLGAANTYLQTDSGVPEGVYLGIASKRPSFGLIRANGVNIETAAAETNGLVFMGTNLPSLLDVSGTGKNVFWIEEAETVPTANVSDAGALYIEDGALKFRGKNGTVTTIASA